MKPMEKRIPWVVPVTVSGLVNTMYTTSRLLAVSSQKVTEQLFIPENDAISLIVWFTTHEVPPAE